MLPAVLLTVLLTACGTGSPTVPVPTATSSAATDASGPLPASLVLDVEVAQARGDRVARVVELEVRNHGPDDVEVTGARLTSDLLRGVATAERGREVPADRLRRLRVPLPPADCTAAPGAATVRVELDVTDAGGRRGTVVVTPTDEGGDLVRVHAEDCAAAAVAAGLDVRLDPGLTVRDVDGAQVADLVLRVTPVPGGPHVRLTSVRATTLLRPAGAVGEWVVDVDSAAPPPDGRVVLPAVPARCDLHAIAEDKRGTVLGVLAEVDGVEQPLVWVAAPDALRGALYDAVLTACGHATDARTGTAG